MSEIDELYSVQLCDNTPKEAQFARAEIEAIIKPIIAERDALRYRINALEVRERKLGAAFQDLLINTNGCCEYCGGDDGNHRAWCWFADWYFKKLLGPAE